MRRLIALLILVACDKRAPENQPVDTVVGARGLNVETAVDPPAERSLLIEGVREVANVARWRDGLLLSAAGPPGVRFYRDSQDAFMLVDSVPIRRSGAIATIADTLIVFDMAATVVRKFRLPSLDSLEVVELPWSTVAVSRGCGGVVAVFETDHVKLRDCAPSVVPSQTTAHAREEFRWPGTTRPNLLAIPSGDDYIAFADIHGRIRTIGCRGERLPFLHVAYPAAWVSTPLPKGFTATTTTAIYFFHERPGSAITYAAICDRSRMDCTTRAISAVVAIVGTEPGVVWIARPVDEGTRLLAVTVDTCWNGFVRRGSQLPI